ncbi:MAG: helix-turn-helix domain-containing protein [Patescibacteria group bacterium]
MDNQKNFHEFFSEIVKNSGSSIEKLAELTSISPRYLKAFCDGDFKKLPSLPYVRGYLMKISNILGIDGQELWSAYKEELKAKIVIDDTLPLNRFALKPRSFKNLAIGIVIIFAIIFLVWRLDDLLGIPKIEIANPANDLIINEDIINIKGTINNYRDKLLINNEEVFIAKDGKFEKEYRLAPGVNNIEFRLKRFLGKETSEVRRVIYQSQ